MSLPDKDKEYINTHVSGGYRDFLHLTFYTLCVEGSQLDYYEVMDNCTDDNPENLRTLAQYYLKLVEMIMHTGVVDILQHAIVLDLVIEPYKIIVEVCHHRESHPTRAIHPTTRRVG